MKIVSCGDSFFYGTDLQDHNKTWPSLIAIQMGAKYQCYAQPGVGNNRILQQVIQAHHDFGDEVIYLINWSWIDRFDYVSIDDEQWHTSRPGLEDSYRDEIYFKHFHSELADKFHSLVCVSQSQQILKNSRYIMTYMDHLLLDQAWHAPDYISYLQRLVSNKLDNFEGKNFLQWSRDQGYPISNTLHPLEEAHQNAAAYWLPRIISL